MYLKKAVIYMVLSTIAFTAMNGLLKQLTYYSGYQLVFFRSLGSLVFTFSVLVGQRIPILGNNPKAMVFRGVLGAISMVLFFLAIHYIPIGSAVALRYISPIFAAIFAILFLRENVRPMQWLFFMLSFLGILVLKGFDQSIPPIGLFLVLLSAVFSGMVYIAIRQIGQSEHPVVIVNYFMFIAALVGGALSIFDWVTPKPADWLWLASLGVFGYYGQLFMTKAFQLGETNVIAPIKYLEVVFAIIVGVLFLGESYSLGSFLGIAMIITGLILNLVYKTKVAKTKAAEI